MKKIELDNLIDLISDYGLGISEKLFMLGIDYHEEHNGADLVIYDVLELGYKVTSQKELNDWCTENGANEEDFEIDRITLVRHD